MFGFDRECGRARITLTALVALSGCLHAVQVLAETADERLQRLENEIQELRQLLREQREAPAPVQAIAPAPAAVMQTVGAYVRYYIQNEGLGDQPPAGVQPVVAGRITDMDALKFDPAAYDVPDAGLLSDYRDPSAYRYVGVELEGDLPVAEAGDYEFVVYPKPAREGGANVATRLSVQLNVDGNPAVAFRNQTSWQAQRGRVRLEPGMHRLRLWAVAASQGFGPSPTASQLLLAIKGPGDASPRPLRELRTPSAVE